MQNNINDNTIHDDCCLDNAIEMLDNIADLPAEEMENLMKKPEIREAMGEGLLCAEATRAHFAPKADVASAWERFAASHEEFAQDGNNGKEEQQEESSGRRTWVVAMRIILSIAALYIISVLIIKPWEETQSYIYTADANLQQVEMSSSEGKQTIDKQEIICKKGKNVKSTNHITVPEGKTLKVTLADGTEVWLNSGSKLSYPEAFDSRQRLVTLQGEAYFKVTHNDSQPFRVKVNGLVVTDVGTEFNIRGYEKHDTHVTLVEGCVNVRAKGHEKALKPGEDATASGNEIRVSTVDTEDFTSWREGVIIFNNASLQDIAVNICKWYQLNLVCKQSDLLQKRLHFVFDRNADVEDALTMLKDISGTTISITDNTLLIEED